MPSLRSLVQEALSEFAFLFDEGRWEDPEIWKPKERERRIAALQAPKKKKDIKPVGRFKDLEMWPKPGERPETPSQEPRGSTRFATLDYYDLTPEQQKAMDKIAKKLRTPRLSETGKAKVKEIGGKLEVRKHHSDPTLVTLKLRGNTAMQRGELEFFLKALGVEKPNVLTGGVKTLAIVPKDWWAKAKAKLGV